MNLWRGAVGDRLQLVDVDPVDQTVDPLEPHRTPEPFDAFYHREFRSVRALARALVGPASADDIAQEAMLVAYRRWDEVQFLDSPSAWVRGVCAHKGVSTLRRRAVERKALGRLRNLPPSGPDPALDHDDTFWSLVRRLPVRQAQVVCLYYALDLEVAEVASTLGCAEGTVKMHLSRARASLARTLRVEEDPS